jgi:Tol biopolymer transport system component
MAAAFGIDRFLNVRSATAPSFSPDGRFVAFLTNITGTAQVWQVAVEGGWPTQLTFGDDSVRGVWYNPIRHILIYAMDSGGDERTQLHLLRGVGGNTDHGLGDGWVSEELTRQPKAVHTFGGWSHDGERFAFSANREEANRFDIYVQKLGDKDAKLLVKGPGGYYTPVGWSPDDKHLLVSREESNFNQDLFVADVESGKVRCLTEHKGDAQYHSAHWSGDGKSIYCASTASGRDLAALAKIDVESGKLSYLERPESEVEFVSASPKGRWLIWLINIDGKSRLVGREVKEDTTVSPVLAVDVVSQVTFSPDDTKMALVFDGPRYNFDV